MPDQPRLRRLLEWSLAAFHAGFLFAALVALLYAGGSLGDLLSSLNTLLGVGLYAVFWLGTWWTTRQSARGLAWSALDRPAALARHLWVIVVWAGVNGLLLFSVLLAGILANTLGLIVAGRAQLGDLLSFLATVGLLGALVAFVIGVVAGLFFALLDALLIVLAGWLVPAPKG